MNRRKAKVWRSGTSLVVAIPKDHAEGMNIRAGDCLDMEYNGHIVLRKVEGGSG